MKRAVAALLTVLACCGAVLALGADGDGSGKSDKTYEIVFDNAFGLTEGGDKVAGVRAGSTSGFRIAGTQARPLALVEARVSEPGLADLRRDARCEIRPQSLIGEYFVECQPGSSDERLPDGGRVRGTDQLDDPDRPGQRHCSPALPGPAAVDRGRAGRRPRGPAGGPERRAAPRHPGLRETSETLRILGRQTDSIQRLITDGETVVGALEDRKTDVTRFVREAGETAEIAASRRSELAESFARLPVSWASSSPTWAAWASSPAPRRRCCGTSGRLPRARRLPQPAAAVCAGGRPALEALGDASRVGLRAVRASDEEVEELRRLARGAPALAKPLRQFLQSIDDRRRAVEPDARAAASAPPPGDPTHTTRARGLHRNGGDLELLLLAGPLHQRVRRRGPHPAPQRADQRLHAVRGGPE